MPGVVIHLESNRPTTIFANIQCFLHDLCAKILHYTYVMYTTWVYKYPNGIWMENLNCLLKSFDVFYETRHTKHIHTPKF